MYVRGIRGATTVERDQPEEIIAATAELLEVMQKKNGFITEDIASALFTVTRDLTAAFPARAARLMGWNQVPLLCFQEIDVKGALPRCIRVLLHINTEKQQNDIVHVYLRDAKVLRQDLSK